MMLGVPACMTNSMIKCVVAAAAAVVVVVVVVVAAACMINSMIMCARFSHAEEL
jgi:hypothetical protein